MVSFLFYFSAKTIDRKLAACSSLGIALNGHFASFETLQSGDAGLRLVAQNTSTPVTTEFVVTIVEVRLDRFDDLAHAGLVVRVHIGQGQGRAGLQVNQSTETSLAFDDAVGNAHLSAQGGQVKHQLDRFDIVSNDHLKVK